MHVPFLDPAFDNQPAIFGFPSSVLVFAVAIALLLAGAVIALRIGRGDQEPRPFRATTHADASDLVTRVVIVGVAGAAGLAALVLLLHL